MLQDLREGVIAAQEDVREALVVAVRHIVAGLEPLDEVGFEQQRFGFRGRGNEDHVRRFGNHPRNAIGMVRRLRIGGDAFLQAAGLADVKHLALGIEHAIDARRRAGLRGKPRSARRLSAALARSVRGWLGRRLASFHP
jgi:hypothetical protein